MVRLIKLSRKLQTKFCKVYRDGVKFTISQILHGKHTSSRGSLSSSSLQVPTRYRNVKPCGRLGISFYRTFLKQRSMKPKHYLLLGFFLITIFASGCLKGASETGDNYCIKTQTGEKLSFSEAKEIALRSECIKEGALKEEHFCNSNTGTWWIDLAVQKEGCTPACVIDVATRQAHINWRCTGALPP